jgi:plastocyanin
MHRTRTLRFALGLSLALGLLVVPAVGSAAQTFTLSAGVESIGGDVQLNEFAPNAVSVNVGDTVTWSLDSTEFHNVIFTSGAPAPDFVTGGPDGVFLNPVGAVPSGGPSYDGSGIVSSGLLNKGQKFSLTFTKAGTYAYLCSIHPGMTGSVRVLETGQTPDTQAAIDARKSAQVNADFATHAVPSIMANVGLLETPTAVAGVAAGIQDGPADVLRFVPRRVIIGEGDSLSWIWKTEDTPHTVTFLAGQPSPEIIIPQPQPSGPPRLQLSPAVLAPAGDAGDWDGGTYLHSGFLAPAPGQPTPAFTVHFSTAGTFDYLCLLHEGMVGTVVVQPK